MRRDYQLKWNLHYLVCVLQFEFKSTVLITLKHLEILSLCLNSPLFPKELTIDFYKVFKSIRIWKVSLFVSNTFNCLIGFKLE